MRVYVNGELACQRPAAHEWPGTFSRHVKLPVNLVENEADLTIGRDGSEPSPRWPFLGLMDDIQFFNVALDAEQIANLSSSGTCPP